MRIGARMAVVGLFVAALLVAPVAPVSAQDEPGLDTDGSIRDALTKLGKGREVELVLTGGKTYRGKIGGVGRDTVLLTSIAGKEFYDVLIDLEEVAAVELRVRK